MGIPHTLFCVFTLSSNKVVLMINICQRRVTIGLWYYHQIPYTSKKGITIDISEWMESLWSGGPVDECSGNLIFSLVLFLLLLILSGDIELNPGPITGKHNTMHEDSDSNSIIYNFKCPIIIV